MADSFRYPQIYITNSPSSVHASIYGLYNFKLPLGPMTDPQAQLINYFLSMSSSHSAIHCLQQQLVGHPYFNPLLLYLHLRAQHARLTRPLLLAYFCAQVPSLQREWFHIYALRHGFVEECISCHQFVGSLLPHAPDSLRNLRLTIDMQIGQAPGLVPEVLGLYHRLLAQEMQAVSRVAGWVRGGGWGAVRDMVTAELRDSEGEVDLVVVRKWMEMRVRVQEREVLDMMRWMGGADELTLSRFYDQMANMGSLCGCRHNSTTAVGNYEHKKQQKWRSKTKAAIGQPSSFQSLLTSRASSLQRTNTPKTKKIVAKPANRGSNLQNSIGLWHQYIMALLQGQRILTQCRQTIRQCPDSAIDVLRERFLSGGSKTTPIARLLKTISSTITVPQDSRQHIRQHLLRYSLENETLCTIVTGGANQKCEQLPMSPQPEQPSAQLICNSVAQILLNYLATKCTLMQLSVKLIKCSKLPQVYGVLRGNTGKPDIDAQTVKQILDEMGYQGQEMGDQRQGPEPGRDVRAIMGHFGDGTRITCKSFLRVFHLHTL